jgi:hypothetical protein
MAVTLSAKYILHDFLSLLSDIRQMQKWSNLILYHEINIYFLDGSVNYERNSKSKGNLLFFFIL